MAVQVTYEPTCDQYFMHAYHDQLYLWVNMPGYASVETINGTVYFDQAHVM